ncbi:ubiquitin/metalloprotease fusion protein [Xylariaceae sp. FL0804]|nr:ubiquitin/metalloprotease fusion protein [Xylariaceae sp. FL0804]
MADQKDAPIESGGVISITLKHHGKEHTLEMPRAATLADLSNEIQDTLHVPTSHQKFMVPKLGMLKPPFGDRPAAAELQGRTVTLLGASSAEMASMAAASERAAARDAHLASARRSQPRAYATRRQQDEGAQYTFETLRPLPNLPAPERSLAFLRRLRDDPGVRAAMRAHRFRVGLLTEMEPLSNTEADAAGGVTRLLGLNRNRGEVIELRLRTDAYDGYRDYRTIRRTLCHELAHNVHGPHDRAFWDLCHQIEREVERADWRSGGRSVDGARSGREADFDYEPSEEVAYDHGGWTGGEFVLGGGGGSDGSAGAGAVSRREVIAKAAEERLKRQRQAQADSGDDASGSKEEE